MRFLHPDGTTVHLAYCANVHPAPDLRAVLAQLATHAEPVRERLGTDRLGVGLWLAREVAAELVAEPASVRALRAELDRRGLEVVTLNGFPYRGFGDAVVKHRVYTPDWSDPARLRHTLDLARLLAELMPDDADHASVSTLPLGWAGSWPAERAALARRHLDTLSAELADLAERTGRDVRIAFEPEPGCVLETTGDAVHHLAPAAGPRLGVCLDTCHLAVAHEQPADALAALADAGLEVVKLQASAALVAPRPHTSGVREALSPYAEPRFLHQTREPSPDGLLGVDDLGTALACGPGGAGGLPGREPWRIHFHMPLSAAPPPPLTTTRPVLEETVALLLGGPVARTAHVEVETYTWPVLPDAPGRDALVDGIAAELAWARELLLHNGLKELNR
ncbi:metabolite traffic protein EboE [Streptomyces sp. PTM05]|uniref:Metabolite traffic protein EboE n=1 Tax=Streptantibioticus parmotrematis TaxID=2873249 RepID=A0ABS7QPY0_9ACTN|nr:metabolite traffic protein EboE [Streptantibioticus parmotrematis]MBY8885251.1 metabolite traffic protein EboE [Streptantibioticus parmotrematis]